MTEINAKIIIQDDILEVLNISDVAIDESIDSWAVRNLSDEISDWMSNHFDIEDYMRDVDLTQYMEEQDDVEFQVKELLTGYSPVTSCDTGEAFTAAVAKAIRAFLHVDNNVEYIIKAIERYNKRKSVEELADSLKEKHYDEFKRELEQYAKTVESNKISQYNQFIQNNPE